MLIDTLQLSDARTIALIGGGGKTTLMWRLAAEARALQKRVLVTTSTHIFPPADGQCDRFISPQSEEELLAALGQDGITCAAYPDQFGKCTGLPANLFFAAQKNTDLLLYEADGAKRLPLKVHRPKEPVLHTNTDVTLILVGLSAIGKPVRRTIHLWDRHDAFRSCPDRPVTADDIVLLINEAISAGGLRGAQTRIILSQADTVPNGVIRPLLERLRHDGRPVFALSPARR